MRAGKPPEFQQERARRSYEMLLAKAEELFAKHGYDAIGTPEIADAAGVSVGTFYRYFEDKHEVYLEIARRNFLAIYQTTVEGLTPARFVGLARRDTIAAAVAVLFDQVVSRPQLSRSFNEMSLRDPAVGEIRRTVEHAAQTKIAELITAVVPRSVISDPEAAALVVYASSMQCAYFVAEHYGPSPVAVDRAKDALVLFIERALFPR